MKTFFCRNKKEPLSCDSWYGGNWSVEGLTPYKKD